MGTPYMMTTTSGAVVWKAKYSSFGIAIVDSIPAVENPLRFPGQYADVETGLHYNWFRYFDSECGRYLRIDPIGFAGGDENLYAYVWNDPIGWLDPKGLSSLKFNRCTNILKVYDKCGKLIGAFSASNNPIKGRKKWPTGRFKYAYYKRHKDHNEYTSYGSYGNFVFSVKDRPGMGVHSGRKKSTKKKYANNKGYRNKTKGCIRTTDDATKFIYETHIGGDKLKYIYVTDDCNAD
jgi:RHS repeat-associated protein